MLDRIRQLFAFFVVLQIAVSGSILFSKFPGDFERWG